MQKFMIKIETIEYELVYMLVSITVDQLNISTLDSFVLLVYLTGITMDKHGYFLI